MLEMTRERFPFVFFDFGGEKWLQKTAFFFFGRMRAYIIMVKAINQATGNPLVAIQNLALISFLQLTFNVYVMGTPKHYVRRVALRKIWAIIKIFLRYILFNRPRQPITRKRA